MCKRLFSILIVFSLQTIALPADATDFSKTSYAASIKSDVISDFNPEKPEFLSIVKTNEKIAYNDQDIFCLAKNIFHEAGTENSLGKFAVAQVTLNRLKTRRPKVPGSLCETVFEPYQFSWANDYETHWISPEGPNWEQSKKVANEVLMGGKRLQGMEKAVYFHTLDSNPLWAKAKDKITQIGSHIFYKAEK